MNFETFLEINWIFWNRFMTTSLVFTPILSTKYVHFSNIKLSSRRVAYYLQSLQWVQYADEISWIITITTITTNYTIKKSPIVVEVAQFNSHDKCAKSIFLLTER